MSIRIFDPVEIGGVQLTGRIIRSATHEGLADDNGRPTDKLIKKYIQLAKGGAGAIITGYAGVQQDGKSCHLNMLMMDRDDLIDAYKPLVAAVHDYCTPVILQIAHCGRETRRKTTGMQPVAPSAVRDKFYSEERPREMSESDIFNVIDSFADAVARAKSAGFDGVQLHLAHGYLLAQFLSPYMNRRKDQWGGSTENRFRIIAEIINKSRTKVGCFPIWGKLNGYDGRKNGMTVDEAVIIAKMLEQVGCDAIEVSCGVFEDGFYSVRGDSLPIDAVFATNFKYKKIPNWIQPLVAGAVKTMMKMPGPTRNYNVPAAEAIKQAVSIPVIVVGGIKSLNEINRIIQTGQADGVAMSRPFIIEPNVVNKFKSGKQSASGCIDCCFCAVAQEERPLKCYYGKMR